MPTYDQVSIPVKKTEVMSQPFQWQEHTTFNEDEMRRFKDSARDKMIQNFSLLIEHITKFDMADDLYHHFNIEDQRYLNQRISKEECLLLNVLSRGSEECYRFIRLLIEKDPEQTQNVMDLMSNLTPEIPEMFRMKYSSIDREGIINMKGYLQNEIEIRKLLIPLMEFRVISVQQYSDVKNNANLPGEIHHLLELLTAREDTDWIIWFLFALSKRHECDQFSQQHILNTLLKKEVPEVIEDLFISSSWTNIVLNVPTYSDVTVDQRNMIFGMGRVVDIWSGSLYLRYICTTADTNFVDKLEPFLLRLYKIIDIKTEEPITIEVVSKNKFIDSSFGKVSYVKTDESGVEADIKRVCEEENCKNVELEKCHMCLQEIVRSNFNTIVGEIETDIIVATFNDNRAIPEYVKETCLNKEKSPSKRQRATFFLNYVLHEEQCLTTFFSHLRRMSNAELDPAKCSQCSTEDEKERDGEFSEQTQMLHFVMIKSNDGKIVVQRKQSESPDPIVAPDVEHQEKFRPPSFKASSQKRKLDESTENVKLKARTDECETKINTDISISRQIPPLRRLNSFPENLNSMRQFVNILQFEEQSREISSLKVQMDILNSRNTRFEEQLNKMRNEFESTEYFCFECRKREKSTL